eukprot:13518698-Alexandrium_andersonii.AAC.1
MARPQGRGCLLGVRGVLACGTAGWFMGVVVLALVCFSEVSEKVRSSEALSCTASVAVPSLQNIRPLPEALHPPSVRPFGRAPANPSVECPI